MKDPDVAHAVTRALAEVLPADEFVVADQVPRIRSWLATHHRQELERWREELIDAAISTLVRRRLQSARRSRRGVFAQRHCVDPEQGLWKSIGRMSGSDWAAVAEQYERRADANLIEAKFHRIMEERVGDRETREVMTEDDVVALRESCGVTLDDDA